MIYYKFFKQENRLQILMRDENDVVRYIRNGKMNQYHANPREFDRGVNEEKWHFLHETFYKELYEIL